jgi:hypothetical protein
MKKYGYNEDGTRIENKKRKANNIGDLITKQQRIYDTVFDQQG